MISVTNLVRHVIARRSGHPAQDVLPSSRLDHDLDLTPLDLALVHAEIEDAADVHLSSRELDRADTVGDLMSIVLRAVALDRQTAGLGRAA